MTLKLIVLPLLFFLCLLPLPTAAQQTAVLPDINIQIRKAELENSQVMRTLHYLTDVYGARLTGSPSHKAAADWAVRQMKEWDFNNVHLEPWNFGHPGWGNERASGFITAPVKDNLSFEVLAWTPGTNGVITRQAFQMIMPDRPTQEELTNYFDSIKNNIKGKIVLVGRPSVIPVNFDSTQKRFDDADLLKILNPNSTPTPTPPTTSPTPISNPTPIPKPGQLSIEQVRAQLNKFLLDNEAAVRINDAARPFGQIRTFNNPNFDTTQIVPTVVMRNEDFGRIARLLGDNIPVTLEFDIRNRTFPEGTTSYNVIGEIAGTDKKDEVIMLGAHLDSWHAATGATDNAIGCVVMMEAARILKTLGVKPRRTIRVALWSGEEEGLLGTLAYVKEHFGSFENPKPEYSKFGGYFNIDSGTGRARGMWVFGPPETATVLRKIVSPFSDIGMLGAISFNSRNTGSSDHTSFNQAGLPGIGIIQDPIEYNSFTWHTNLDNYERVIEADAKDTAIVIAGAVYQLAMSDQLLPRFKSEEIPKFVASQ